MRKSTVGLVGLAMGLCLGLIPGLWKAETIYLAAPGPNADPDQASAMPTTAVVPPGSTPKRSVAHVTPVPPPPSSAEAAAAMAEHESAPPQKRTREEVLTELDKAVLHHDSQRRDARFASRAASLLDAALTAASPNVGYELASIECKTNSCMATLKWDTYHVAHGAGKRGLLFDLPGMSCARGTVMPEPDDPELPYESMMFLDGCVLSSEELATASER